MKTGTFYGCLALAITGFGGAPIAAAPAEVLQPPEFCASLPRPENAVLPPVSTGQDWFQVYRAADGVYAFVEAWQFQETISYLILGTERALLFDTGLGLLPLRPVVRQLTDLPLAVLNSHTHFDHVGGNAEFDEIFALDTPYTRANMAGFPHDELAAEVAPEALCRPAPAGVDSNAFHTRAWSATRHVRDGEVIDLGGRQVEILHVPGHTPDALALLDRAKGLLWTGDSYYDGPIWLFVPETDLDAYQRSMEKLAALAPGLRQLLPAHNSASADPKVLREVVDALTRVRQGSVAATAEPGGRLVFEADGITFITAQQVLDRRASNAAQGGSGLDTWP